MIMGDDITQCIRVPNNQIGKSPINNQYNGMRDGFWTLLAWWEKEEVHLQKPWEVHADLIGKHGAKHGKFIRGSLANMGERL